MLRELLSRQVQAHPGGETTAAVFHSGWLSCFILSAQVKKSTTEAVTCDVQDKNMNEWTCKLHVIPRGRASASGAVTYYPSHEH